MIAHKKIIDPSYSCTVRTEVFLDVYTVTVVQLTTHKVNMTNNCLITELTSMVNSQMTNTVYDQYNMTNMQVTNMQVTNMTNTVELIKRENY